MAWITTASALVFPPELLAQFVPGDYIVSLLAGVFLVFYGIGLVGWPYNVIQGVKVLEKMSPALRQFIGVVLIAAGLFMILWPLR